MTHISESMNSAGVEQESAESLASQEQPANTLARVFDEIKSIEESAESKPDARVAEIALRLGADQSEVELAKQKIGFEEQAQRLSEKAQEIKTKFQKSIQKALLPVATALAMNSTPALAQEANTERPTAAGPETVLATKSESRELKREDVFDLNSPLAITGERMKRLKREMLPEELKLMREFQKKVWQEKNEWAADSWVDQTGNFRTDWFEGDRYSVTTPKQFLLLKTLRKNESHTHSHPLESNTFTITPGPQPDVMPPSGADISNCAQSVWNNGLIYRLVDPRGVWEYHCEKQHPFLRAKNMIIEGIETVGMSRGLEQEDMAKLRQSLRSISSEATRTDILVDIVACLSELDKKYPGLKENTDELMTDFSRATQRLAVELLDNENWAGWLMRNSSHYSDEELAVRIKNYIDSAEQKGVYMSYTPFKELPKDKVRQKE